MNNAKGLPSENPGMSIIVRHYREDLYSHKSRAPKKQRPTWFSNALCIGSLLWSVQESTRKERINIIIWYDGTKEDYENDPAVNTLERLTIAWGLNVKVYRFSYHANGGNTGGIRSWRDILNYISESIHDELIYLVESDYLHRPTAVSALFEGFETIEDADYINLADHRDYYDLPIHVNHTTRLRYTKNNIFKSCLTTTGTYAAKRTCLTVDLPVILNYPDYFCFLQLTGIHGRKLYTAIPGQAAHCMNDLLPPSIQWEQVANEAGQATASVA